VIQRAAERALAHGMTLRRVLEMVADFRRDDGVTPVVLMGYLNPVEAMGYEAFASAAAKAGVDGVLTVDAPPEEASDFTRAFTAVDIAPIFLTAPNTDEARLRTIGAAGKGFLYHVSLKGVTGAANLDVDAVARKVMAIRESAALPVAVGFGIKDAASAAQVSAVADGVVVGSALVRLIEESLGKADATVLANVSECLRAMRVAIDEAASKAR
jgi:tryptophan synthase alpha chain